MTASQKALLFLDKVVIRTLVLINAPRVLAYYYSKRLSRHSLASSVIAENGPKPYRFLALSQNIFRHDLEILSGLKDFAVFSLPFHMQTLLMARFFSESYDLLLHHNPPAGSKIETERRRYCKYLTTFLHTFYRITGINCVLSANVKFKEDLDWGVISNRFGVPFVILHRENFVACPNIYNFTLERQKVQGRFYGSLIVVHNEFQKRLFVDAGTAPASEIKVLGCLRMDSFIKGLSNVSYTDHRRKVVGIFGFTSFYRLPMDADYFADTHEKLLGYILRSPELDFIVKPKPKSHWSAKFMIVMKKLSLSFSDLPNLKIMPSIDAHELIAKSDVVSGFNSTTLLEAGLTGKPIVVPYYRKFREDIVFRQGTSLGEEMEGAFAIADDPDHYVELLETLLTSPEVSTEMMQKRQFLFEKWVSSLQANALDLYSRALRDVIEHAKKTRNDLGRDYRGL